MNRRDYYTATAFGIWLSGVSAGLLIGYIIHVALCGYQVQP